MSLNVQVDLNGKSNIWLIAVKGDLDIYTSNKFKDQVLEAFNENKQDLEIDGEHLDYVDSTGLGVLISILKTVREDNSKIYFKNIKPNIRKIFDITDLDKLFVFRGEDDE